MKTPPSSPRNLAQTLPREERKREKNIARSRSTAQHRISIGIRPHRKRCSLASLSHVSDCLMSALLCVHVAPAVCCLHSCFHLPVSIGFYRGSWLRLLLLCAPLLLSSIAALPLPPPPPPPLNPLRFTPALLLPSQSAAVASFVPPLLLLLRAT